MPDRPQTGPRAFFLVGPTAVGKSDVAHHLALQDGYSILSVDAMQVYKGMDIGTAKPERSTLDRIPYWGIDLVTPDQSFSVGQFMAHAQQVFRVEDSILVTGGTGLYVKCLTQGLDDQPHPPRVVRKKYQRLLEEGGVTALQNCLKDKDPEAFRRLPDPHNPRRLQRCLERCEMGLDPLKAWTSGPPPELVGLKMDKDALYMRIQERVHRMYEKGLIEEVKQLKSRYSTWSATAAQAIGYREALEALHGNLSIPEAIQQTALRTRQLAKRQMTWFRNQARVHWITVGPSDAPAVIADTVRSLWSTHGSTPIHT